MLTPLIETQDYQALTKAINQGDDSVLPILADWLEDQGNPLHIGLRKIISSGKVPCDQKERHHRSAYEKANYIIFSWYEIESLASRLFYKNYWECYTLPREIFSKLVHTGDLRFATDYNTRWEAYKDLARVLSEEHQ